MIISGRHKLSVMFIFSYLAYSVIYIARLNFSVAASVMESGGILSNTQIGIIGSAFSIVYAFSKVPNGYMGDRLNTRFTVILGLFIAGMSNIAVGIMPVFPVMALFWGLNAFGQAMLWGPLLRSFTEKYPSDISKKITPYLASSIGMGSVAGLLSAMMISARLGTSACFIIPGAVCLIIAVLCALFLEGAPANMQGKNESLFRVIFKLFRDRKFRRIVLPAIGHGMVKDNVSVWMVVFFVTAYGVNVSEVTAYVLFIPVCTLIGRLLYPLLFGIVKNSCRLSAISYAATAIAAGIVCIPGVPMWCSAVCLGLISALASVINTHLVTIFPQKYVGENLCFVASTLDLLVYGGAAAGSAIFGYVIDLWGFSSMFLIWMLCSAVCIPLILRSRDNV